MARARPILVGRLRRAAERLGLRDQDPEARLYRPETAAAAPPPLYPAPTTRLTWACLVCGGRSDILADRCHWCGRPKAARRGVL